MDSCQSCTWRGVGTVWMHGTIAVVEQCETCTDYQVRGLPPDVPLVNPEQFQG